MMEDNLEFIEEYIPSFPEVILKQLIFLERANVQNQLLIIILCIILGWLISKGLWFGLQKNFSHRFTFPWSEARNPLHQSISSLVKNLDFPLITLILLELSRHLFMVQNWTRGLVNVAIRLMWLYLFYRLILLFLYAVFPQDKIRKYHFLLFAPLFIISVLITIIQLYQNIEKLAKISLFNFFNSPLTLGAIFLLTVGVYLWMVIVTFLETLFLELLRHKGQPKTGVAEASSVLIRYAFITIGIILILGYIGINSTALAAMTGGLSLGIGFGLKEVISNFVSGLILLFEGVLKPGDIIDIEGQISQVKKLGIRATTVRIIKDNSEKIIPNQKFFTSDVTTYTGSDHLIYCSITVGVAYHSLPEKVMSLLLEIAKEHPRVLKQPEPLAFFLDFGEFSLNFELKFWLDDIQIKKRVISDLSCAILDTFTQYKIEIPFPKMDVHLGD